MGSFEELLKLDPSKVKGIRIIPPNFSKDPFQQAVSGENFALEPLPAEKDCYTVGRQTPKGMAQVKPMANFSDWQRLGERAGPRLRLWMLVSGIAAGGMLYLSPVASSSRMLISIGVVLLAPLVLWLGWITGVSNFAVSCQTFRKGNRTASLIWYLLPILVAAIVALGLLGGRWWWLFSIAVAVQGTRKGARRAWWSAVACSAYGLRSLDRTYGSGLFATDEEALAAAIDGINKEVGIGPVARELLRQHLDQDVAEARQVRTFLKRAGTFGGPGHDVE